MTQNNYIDLEYMDQGDINAKFILPGSSYHSVWSIDRCLFVKSSTAKLLLYKAVTGYSYVSEAMWQARWTAMTGVNLCFKKPATISINCRQT